MSGVKRDGVKRDCVCLRVTHKHGTMAGYTVDRCGCFACRVAHSNASHSYRYGGTWREAEWAPTIGVRRRLQALAVIGHSAAAVGARIGMSGDYIAKLRAPSPHDGVRRATYDAVAAVYDELWNQPNTTPNGRRCSTQAKNRRWAPPLAWDDETMDRVDATPQHQVRSGLGRPPIEEDAVESVLRLTRNGWSAADIAQHLRITSRTVQRYRAAGRAAA